MIGFVATLAGSALGLGVTQSVPYLTQRVKVAPIQDGFGLDDIIDAAAIAAFVCLALWAAKKLKG